MPVRDHRSHIPTGPTFFPHSNSPAFDREAGIGEHSTRRTVIQVARPHSTSSRPSASSSRERATTHTLSQQTRDKPGIVIWNRQNPWPRVYFSTSKILQRITLLSSGALVWPSFCFWDSLNRRDPLWSCSGDHLFGSRRWTEHSRSLCRIEVRPRLPLVSPEFLDRRISTKGWVKRTSLPRGWLVGVASSRR